MAMKGFRYQRFSHLLRWELHSHKRHYLGLSGGVTLAFLLVQICMFKGKPTLRKMCFVWKSPA